MDGWTDRQLAEEREMSRLGEERYRRKMARAVERGKEANLGPAKELLKASVGTLTESFLAFIKASKGMRGKPHTMVSVFKQIPPEVAALITAKAVLDSLTQEQDFNTAARKVGQAIEDEIVYRIISRMEPRKFKDLLKNSRTNLEALRTLHRSDHGELWAWSIPKRHKVGLWCTHMLLETTQIFDKRTFLDYKKHKRIVLVPTEATLKFIRDCNEKQEALAPFFLPTSAPPKDWTQGKDGGYMTPLVNTPTFVKTYHRQANYLLGSADLSQVDLAVNRLQAVPFEVSAGVLKEFKECLLDNSPLVPSLYKKPIPPKPEEDADKEVWKDWKRQAGRIHRANTRSSGRYLKAQMVRKIAEDYSGKIFYFPQRLDFRGRVYPLPNYLNIQGEDMCRALLRFSKREPIGHDGIAQLQIHIANLFGQDKVRFPERLEWFAQHEKDVLSEDFWSTSDTPFQALAACREYRGVVASGANFLTSLPISQDCTNSGIQMYSLLLRDPVGAKWTNCSSEDQRFDLYAEVARLTKLPPGWEFLKDGLPRSCAKRPVMTLSYGATRHSCQRYVIQWFEENFLQDYGKGNPFGFEKHFKPCMELADALWTAMQARVGRPLELMDWMREASDRFLEEGKALSWTSPTGLPVYQRKDNQRSYTVRTKVGDCVRHIRYNKGTGRLSKRQMANSLPPNYIHSLDASMVHKVAAGFQGNLGVIHDCFLTTAPSCARLKAQVRRAVYEMFAADPLAELHRELSSQLSKPLSAPPELGDFQIEEILTSPYFLA